MNAEIKNNQLIITIPISPRTSKSGKSLVIASTGGNVATGLEHGGKPVILGLNAYTTK